jgi:ATP-binding cassette subfamily F protein uup
MIVIDADRVTVRLPDKDLFSQLSATISTGDRVGVVGINGSGKSTLLKVLAGDVKPDAGEVRRGRGAHISVLEQDPKLAPGAVRDSVLVGIEHANSWEVETVLDHLGMGAMLDAHTSTLSGGQAKRVALARALVTDSDLLILDEPTNHLDLDAIAWLEERLAKFRGAVLMVSHDRHVLDRVCTKVLELDRGTGYVHEGGYQGYLNGRAQREEHAAAAEATRKNLASRELEWLRRGAPARTRKSKARIDSATALIQGGPQAAARAGAFELTAATSRTGEGQGPSAGSVQGSYRNSIDEKLAPRLGNKVIELHGVGHQFASDNAQGPWLFRDLDLILDPGATYGIVGANGTGKSTLLEILSGRITPATGHVENGPTIRVGYYDQRGRDFDLSQRVRDAVAGKHRTVGSPEDKRLMEQFWFTDELQFSPIGMLSGGERRRLQLLLVLAKRPNVLLLDEPTNDLDLDTLRVLEEFLETWPGTLVVVSHDRTFMDRTVQEVISIEGGKASLVAGGYAGWREQRERRIASTSKSASRKTADVSNAKATSTMPKHTAANTAGSKPKRSPSTLTRLLKDAEKEIARLGRERDRLARDLDAAGSDFSLATKIGTQLTDVLAKIDAQEHIWLELSTEADA